MQNDKNFSFFRESHLLSCTRYEIQQNKRTWVVECQKWPCEDHISTHLSWLISEHFHLRTRSGIKNVFSQSLNATFSPESSIFENYRTFFKKKREDFFLQLSESDNVMSLSIKAFSPNIMTFSATYSKI